MAKLDPTWQMGIVWGAVMFVLTVAGVWMGVRNDSTMPIGLGVVGWLLFAVWLDRGLKK